MHKVETQPLLRLNRVRKWGLGGYTSYVRRGQRTTRMATVDPQTEQPVMRVIER